MRLTKNMALKIVDACVNCWACVDVCPSNAVVNADPHFMIDEKKCNECNGIYAHPQCASICPIESAILNSLGEALNPPGSLTGIPPERIDESLHEIQTR